MPSLRPSILATATALLLAGLGLHAALGYRDAGPAPPPPAAAAVDLEGSHAATLRRAQQLERAAAPAQAVDNADPRLVRAASILAGLAARGDRDAAFRLGWYYVNGWGVERDRCTAAELFYRAARSGQAEAQFWLAMAYLPPNGRGVVADKLLAFQWASAARDAGLPIARDLFHFFVRDLSPAERAAAEASLAEWRPEHAPAPEIRRFPYVPILVGLWPRQLYHVMPCRQPLAPFEDWQDG